MFNRNIVTQADVDRVTAATTTADLPRTFDTNPPAGTLSSPLPVGDRPPGYRGPGEPAAAPAPPVAPGPGGVAVPTEDDYLTKILKYVPVEVLGFYLVVGGVIDSNVTKPRDHAIWLGGLLIGTLILTALYDYRVLNVVRGSQIAVSLLALTVYVFAVGGWFATTSWYHQWYASIVVPVFALFIAIIRLSPLPPVGDRKPGGG